MKTPKPIRTPEEAAAAVRRHGGSLRRVPERLKTPELCMAAVRKNGGALKYVPDALKTEEMCMDAVMQEGWALHYVPEEPPYGRMGIERDGKKALRRASMAQGRGECWSHA